MNILALGAHPDDLDISCGGTLLRFRRAGENVVMCVVTDGRAHPLGDPEQVSARRREAQASADWLGAELVWLGFPDGLLLKDENGSSRIPEKSKNEKSDRCPVASVRLIPSRVHTCIRHH